MTDVEYIPGTDEGSRYRVVAKRGRVRLALKPVFTVNPLFGLCFAGFNVRSAVPDSEIGDKPVTAQDLTTVWPKVKFDKADEKRASVAHLHPIKPAKNKMKAIDVFEQAVLDKDHMLGTMKCFFDQANIELLDSNDTVAEWLRECMYDMLLEAKAKPEKIDEADISSKVDEELGKIFKKS